METMNSGTGRRLRSGVNGKTCSRSSERVQKKLTGNFQVFSSFYPFKLVAGWRNNALFTESKVNSTFVSFIWTRRPCPSVRMKNGHVQALSWRRVTFPFFLLSVWMQLLWTTSREIPLTAGIGPAFWFKWKKKVRIRFPMWSIWTRWCLSLKLGSQDRKSHHQSRGPFSINIARTNKKKMDVILFIFDFVERWPKNVPSGRSLVVSHWPEMWK